MIQNLVIAFQAVTPMFLLIAVGYFIQRKKFLDAHSIKKVNTMLFNTMFPCVAFYSLYGANIHEAFDPALIGYSVLMAILLWSLTIPLVMKLEKDPAKRGAMIQAINRSNFLVIGFPIVENICGKENLAATALTIVGMLLVNNIFAVVVLEVFRGSRPKPLHMLKEILLNPIILATVVGTLCMVTEIQFPYVIEKTITSLGSTASSLALVVMGSCHLHCRKIDRSSGHCHADRHAAWIPRSCLCDAPCVLRRFPDHDFLHDGRSDGKRRRVGAGLCGVWDRTRCVYHVLLDFFL